MLRLPVISSYFLIIVSVFLIILCGNWIIYAGNVSIKDVIATSLIIIIYFIVVERILYNFWKAKLYLKLLSASLLFLVFYTLYDIVYFYTYEFLPKIDIVLYTYKISPDDSIFKKSILRSFNTLLIISLFFSARRVNLFKIRRKGRQIEELQYRMALSASNPHFFHSIFNSSMGRSLMGKGDMARDILVDFSEIVNYVLNNDSANSELVRFKEEWIQVERFVKILNWKYGENKVKVLKSNISINSDYKILPLSLLSILENANKYADWSHSSPIEILMELKNETLEIEIINAFNPNERKKMHSGKFGISTLESRLSRYASNYRFVYTEDGNKFCVKFYLFDYESCGI